MKPLFTSASLAAMFLAAAVSTVSVATAATQHQTAPHGNAAAHTKYASACTALADQWTTAMSEHSHSRHLAKAKHQERLGERECKADRTAALKAGTLHYRSALRLLGVKPHA